MAASTYGDLIVRDIFCPCSHVVQIRIVIIAHSTIDVRERSTTDEYGIVAEAVGTGKQGIGRIVRHFRIGSQHTRISAVVNNVCGKTRGVRTTVRLTRRRESAFDGIFDNCFCDSNRFSLQVKRGKAYLLLKN